MFIKIHENNFMSRYIFLLTFLLIFLNRNGFSGIETNDSGSVFFNIIEQDSLKDNQVLYNGRAWRNLYSRVEEDQFLFSKEFLPGSVTINGKSFKNLNLKYDIYNEEIITLTNHGSFLQLNKEMVDSFTFIFGTKTYRFTNIRDDSLMGIKGYVDVLYNCKSALYVKYRKEIEPLAVDGKYDKFFQSHKIYFIKDGIAYQINSKGDLFKVLNKDKAQLSNFIKKNKLKISKKKPESFIPVIEYYDRIRL
jgi:hypothetical protein